MGNTGLYQVEGICLVRDQRGSKNNTWRQDIKTTDVVKLYVQEKKSLNELAQLFFTNPGVIRTRLREKKIRFRTYKEQMSISYSQGRRGGKSMPGQLNPGFIHGNSVGQKRNRAVYLAIAKANIPWVCEHCGSTKTNNTFDLVVHHINLNNKDNTLENLQVLCQGCHAKHHVALRMKLRMKVRKKEGAA